MPKKYYNEEDLKKAFEAGRQYHTEYYPLSEVEIFDMECEGIPYDSKEHRNLRHKRTYKDFESYKTEKL